MFIYGSIIAIGLSLILFIVSLMINISLIAVLIPIILWLLFIMCSFIVYLIVHCKLEKKKYSNHQIFKGEDPTYFQ